MLKALLLNSIQLLQNNVSRIQNLELVIYIHILDFRDLVLKQLELDLSGDTTGSPLETTVKSSQVLTSSLLQLRGSLDSDPNLTRSARSLVCFLSFLLANMQDVIMLLCYHVIMLSYYYDDMIKFKHT